MSKQQKWSVIRYSTTTCAVGLIAFTFSLQQPIANAEVTPVRQELQPYSSSVEEGRRSLVVNAFTSMDQSSGAIKQPKTVLTITDLVEVSNESLPKAPESFAIDNGRIYIDNAKDDSISIFQNGNQIGAMPTNGIGIVDIGISKGEIYILNNENDIIQTDSAGGSTLTKTNRIAKKMSISMTTALSSAVIKKSLSDTNPQSNARRIDFTDGQLKVRSDDDRILEVDNGRISELYQPETFDFSNNEFYVKDGTGHVKYTISSKHEPIEISELYRDKTDVYYFVCESTFSEKHGNVYEKYVYRFSMSGAYKGVYQLETEFDYSPNRNLVVTGGKVYQMLIKGSDVQILELPLLSKVSGRFYVDAPAESSYTTTPNSPDTSIGVQKAAPKKLKRSHTVTIATRYANISWTYSASKNGDKSVISSSLRSKVTQPSYLVGVKGTKTLTGYPYAWGGYDSDGFESWYTHSGSNTWSTFAQAMTSGAYAGNVKSSDGYIPKTAGIDCSGLVSIAYRLGSKYGTNTLFDNIHFKSSTSKPVAGDIYNKAGSHVVVVADRRKENGAWKIVVAESTTASDLDRVVHRVRAESGNFTGYVTGKYQNWE